MQYRNAKFEGDSSFNDVIKDSAYFIINQNICFYLNMSVVVKLASLTL